MNVLLKDLYKKYSNEIVSFDCEQKNTTTLLPHQLRVKDFFNKYNYSNDRGLLLYHGLGSGKTITSIISSFNPKPRKTTSNKTRRNPRIVVLTPASLKDNYKNEINKLKYPITKFSIMSYNTSKITKELKTVDNKIVIVDEAHNLFSMIASNSKIGEYIYDLFINGKNTRFLFLSGTPIINTPYELALLFNVLRPKLFFNTDYFKKDQFEDVYVLHEYNHKVFAEKVKGLSSYFAGITTNNIFPKMESKIIVLNMTKTQEKYYNIYKNKENAKLEKQQEMYKVYTRQVCNFAQIEHIDKIKDIDLKFKLNEYSPKYAKMLNIIKYSQGPILIYSNFKEVGVDLISRILELNDITYIKWTGDESDKQRQTNLTQFNDTSNKNGDKIKCLLITSAGAEGISLKNVKQVHIIEPHWNANREQQVIGRARRICSHIDLPINKRHVKVFKYYVVSRRFKTTDVLIHEIANRKNKVIQKFLKLIVDSAFDCIFDKTQKQCLLNLKHN